MGNFPIVYLPSSVMYLERSWRGASDPHGSLVPSTRCARYGTSISGSLVPLNLGPNTTQARDIWASPIQVTARSWLMITLRRRCPVIYRRRTDGPKTRICLCLTCERGVYPGYCKRKASAKLVHLRGAALELLHGGCSCALTFSCVATKCEVSEHHIYYLYTIFDCPEHGAQGTLAKDTTRDSRSACAHLVGLSRIDI